MGKDVNWADKEWKVIVNDTLVESAILEPLRLKRGRKIFTNSMSDLFHPGVTDDMLDRIFAVMALTPQHTYQVLTKRPERMLTYLTDPETRIRVHRQATGLVSSGAHRITQYSGMHRPLPNVWLGVSMENQKAADERLDLLCDVADMGWQTMVSFEPLLSAIASHRRWLALGGRTWAIVGGESGKGPGIRPSHPDWFRSLRDQCAVAGVPFFFAGWGEWLPLTQRPPEGTNPTYSEYSMLHRDGSTYVAGDECCPPVSAGVGYGMARVGKKAAGDLLDGQQHHAFPEMR